ncbi:MAG: enoyl-CoA hydratase/carnithine racemase [Actinomycetia bacterium]|nr:enoyl-CoA hydratase/carnithine racemase [Actinomycetes bacterium]
MRGFVSLPFMADDLILTERRDDGVTLITLNRPPMNPLSEAMLEAIAGAAEDLGADPSVKAVVITGGEKAFAAGADIKEFGDQDAARKIGATFRRAFDAVAAIPRPVIAAIRGYALGGGLELALSCDFRVAGEAARLGQPEILLGIVPGAGGTQRLPRLIGPARAKNLIFSGHQVHAPEALAIGLVDKVVADHEVLEAALHWAHTLAGGAVVAVGLAKRAIDLGLDGPLAQGLDIEAGAFVEVFGTEDAKAGIASFLDHGPGKAKFAGR